jgi:ABC-type oligopeptide transport system ATPase subunit
MRYPCTRVAVTRRGEIAESGETDEVFSNPRHGYTQRLLDAVRSNWGRAKIGGRFPDDVKLL